MSEQEAAEEQTEAAENEENASDEQPDIEPDEQADIGELADLAEQVEEEAGADIEEDQDEEDEGSEQSDPPSERTETTDWGDLYVSSVTSGLNAVIDKHGVEDAEKIDESLARDLHIDEYVDQWMAEQGKAEMDPAQGMVIATAALCGTVLVSRTDLPNKAVSKLQNDG